MSDEQRGDRPLLVTIVGGLYFLVGIAWIVLGIAGGLSVNNIGNGLIIGIVAGIIPLIVGFGLLKGWRVMWYLGVIFAIIGAIGSLLLIPIGIISLIIELIILFYLFKANVKEFFRI